MIKWFSKVQYIMLYQGWTVFKISILDTFVSFYICNCMYYPVLRYIFLCCILYFLNVFCKDKDTNENTFFFLKVNN